MKIQCTRCSKTGNAEDWHRYVNHQHKLCNECYSLEQNNSRKYNIHVYLSKTYDNMVRRCNQLPSYTGKLHITRSEFIFWGKDALPKFMKESNLDMEQGYTNRGISIDKIDDSVGYKLGNLQFMLLNKNIIKGAKKVMKKVIQYDLEGNLIATHDSLADAARAVGGSYKRISDVVHGLRPTMYGYKWEKLGD